jgi:glutamate racemase
MKIGVFDSGLGGLIVMHSLAQELPDYEYVYLGDAARVPYGNRSHELVYKFTRDAIEFLFSQDCHLVIVACNTASAEALRRIQREYLPGNYPGRRVLGVLIPTAEMAIASSPGKTIGVLATAGTVTSGTFTREIHKLDPGATVLEHAAPLLVPLIENEGTQWAEPILEAYLRPFIDRRIDSLILGCTHYPVLKAQIRAIVGPKVAVLSQDEFIPGRLADYLQRHPEVAGKLAKAGSRRFFVTDVTPGLRRLANDLYYGEVALELVSY